MAPKDKPPTGPPKIDRSRQINSMSKVMKDANNAVKKQQQMSKSINSLMVKQLEEQKNLGKNKRSPLAESKDVKEITNSVNDILKKLGYVVDNLSQGVKKITVETAKATKQAMDEYGQAISADISVNKQNIVAMAIAKSSPVLGYFTSKFFETTVFKNMAEKVRRKFHDVFSAVSDKFKVMFSRMVEGLKGFFTMGKKGKERGEEIRAKRIPAMQAGGYVEKGGLAKLHAAEVVVPVEKFLKTIRESFALAKEDNKRIIDELRMLRYGLTGAKSEFSQRLAKTLMDFPIVRGYLATTQTLKNINRFFTYSRGKYRRMLPRGGADLGSVNSILGLIFTQGMYKLDVIIHHLATLVKGLLGKEPSLPDIGTSSTRADDVKQIGSIFFPFLKTGFTKGKEKITSKATLARQKLEERKITEKSYGIESPADKAKSILSNVLRFVSSPQEAIAMVSAAAGPAQAKALENKLKAEQKIADFRSKIREKGKSWKETVKEGPKVIEKKLDDLKISTEKVAKNTKSIAKGMWEWTKFLVKLPFKLAFWTIIKLPGKILDAGKWMVKNIGGTIKDIFTLFIWPAITSLTSLVTKGLSLPFKFFKALGVGKAIGGLGRLAGGIGATIMAISDIFDGLSKAKEWFGEGAGKEQDIASGIGSFLGGTKSGFEGMFAGALKGIGFGLSVGGIKGAAIGGALGAIFGYIGGERIAKFIEPAVKAITDFCEMVGSIFGKAIDWLKDQRKEIAEKGLFGWIASMISSTAGRENIPGAVGPAAMGEAVAMTGDAYPRMTSQVSAMSLNTQTALMIRDAILEGYSVVGKVVKEEMEDQQTMMGKSAGIPGFGGFATTAKPAVTPAKAQAIVEDSTKTLVQHAAEFLAGGTASLTDAVVQRAGKGVHLEGMNPEFASRFAGMAKEYMDQTGKKITVTDAFRSSEEQARLYAMKPHLAAPPGRSRHEKGMAMDIDTAQANQLYASGLMEKYGFYRPMYPPWGGGPGRKTEGWHLELAKGTQIGDAWPAVKMSQKDIARMQVGDAFAGADMLASTVGANSAALRGALSGFGRETSTVLVNMTNVISNAVQNAVSNKQGGGSSAGQTDPMLQNILTGNFG